MLFYAVCLDISLHFMYVPAMLLGERWKPENAEFWASYKLPPISCWEAGSHGFVFLIFMYMKFLIIWRFFRLWALFDGMNCPENMNRCINNNYTFSGFWRSWHRSLNEWIVRYMYKPLGGTDYIAITVWPIFIFIAIWHDLWWRWVVWALCNCVFMVIEVSILHFASTPKVN